MTNWETANVLYIYDVQDTTVFDPQFEEALALRLALDINFAISQNSAHGQRLHALYSGLLAEARSSDGQEGTPEIIQEGDWLDTRV